MVASEFLPAAEFGCDIEPIPADEIRVVYGPFWDGAWRMTVSLGDDGTPPSVRVERFDFLPAEHRVEVTATHERSVSSTHLRRLRQASLTMVNEIRLKEEVPELRSERRPLTVQVGLSDGGMQCARGFANWPHLPGSYYFEAVNSIRAMVENPAVGDNWPAVRLMLGQVKAAHRR